MYKDIIIINILYINTKRGVSFVLVTGLGEEIVTIKATISNRLSL